MPTNRLITDRSRIGKSSAPWLRGLLGLGLLLFASKIEAGPNADGFLLVHAALNTNLTTVQRDEEVDLRDCAEVISNVEANDDAQVVLWVLAAFPSYVSPRIAGILFGIDFDGPDPIAHGRSRDFDFSVADAGWPGAFTGIGLNASDPVEDEIVGVYWFVTYAYEGTYFAVTDHPNYGQAVFADDTIPSIEDEVEEYGRVGFGIVGDNPCLGDIPQGGCCLFDGTCQITYETVCDIQDGTYLGDDEPCFAGVCEGACCLENECFVSDIMDCDLDGGEFMGVGRRCGTLSCLREETTWGALKHGYRDDY